MSGCPRSAVRALTLLVFAACGPTAGTPDGSADAPVDARPTCPGGGENLQCFQVACPGSGPTTLTGTVYAPNGTLPIYNATVYVPNGIVEPFTTGVACDRCADTLSGDPLVATTTDTSGRFILRNVPATQNVPVVIQIGRWRRQIVLDDVPACESTEVGAEQTSLPRNKGLGDIPQMAVSTGGYDAIECLLRKIGLEDGEFTSDAGDGRVHMFHGIDGTDAISGGATLADSQTLWATTTSLSRYDVVFLSCEGGQNPDTKLPDARQAMFDYTNLGGRVFASHYHNYWLQAGPAPWSEITTITDLADLDDIEADIDTSYLRGMDMAQWLVNVQASPNGLGRISITDAQHTVTDIDETRVQRVIYKDVTANAMPSVQYFSFTTPLTMPEEDRCGRVVFSDIHVSNLDGSSPDLDFPSGCQSTGLSPQEKVLAFMIFDIASCIGTVD
jgi:hypothetical protein